MYKSHLYSLALDAVHKTIANRAAHQQEKTKPADYRGPCFPGQGLIQLMGVERAVENDDGPYELGEGDHGVEPLKAFKCCVLVLATLFISAHVQVRESHFENCICNTKLVILCYGDDVHVPGKDEDERNDDTDEDMDNGICNGGGEVWKARSLSNQVNIS